MGLHQDLLESADGGAFINLRDAAGTGLTSTLNSGKQSLDVNITGGSSSAAVADKTAFTYGTTVFQNTGGVYQDTSPTLTAGQSGALRLNANRGLHTNLRDSSGNEMGSLVSTGLWVRSGDGTNAALVSATGEAFAQIRQGANAATVTASNELKVVETNSAAILALMKAATGTISSPAITTGSTTLLAANSARKGFSFQNESLFPVCVAFAATASLAAFSVKVNPNTYFEQMSDRVYTGIITMISTGSSGLVQVTEYT